MTRHRAVLSRLRHPQTTVRWRLTLLYGGLFLVCGAALLAITYTLVAHATALPGPAQFARLPPGARGPVILNSDHPGDVTISDGSAPAQVEKLLSSKTGLKAAQYVVAGQRGADLHQLEVESTIALAIMAIISGLLGWLVAGRVLRPLRTITATAHEISEASLHRRLALPGPRDELRQLADTIDGLLARLEGAFDAQRQFVANASHELRTPLTAARALLEMVITDPHATVTTFRETCQHVLKENEYQEQLIDALLTLAQGQRGLDRREQVDLSAIVAGVLEANDLDIVASGLTLESSLGQAGVAGDPRLIERLVTNLVQNAIRHNAPNGQIAVSVRADGTAAALEVSNTGPIVPPEEVERLLAPFQRLARERTDHGDGLGLGLSIVAAVAQAHGAELEIRPCDGGGLTARVRFPLQLVLEHLPQRVARERIHELHPAGPLEAGKSFGGELQ